MKTISKNLHKLATTPRIRVLVADDHGIVREGLSALIGRQPDMIVVGEAANGREAVEQWCKNAPDVTLLDLRMPLLDGFGATEEICRKNAAARIIILSTFDADEDIFRAIKAGAKGYLLKDAEREELLNAIRRVHTGETCIPPELVTKLAAAMGNKPLTNRELVVLKLLAKGKSNKQIAADLFVSETTVKSHFRSIFNKMNVLSRTEAITEANRRGLIQL